MNRHPLAMALGLATLVTFSLQPSFLNGQSGLEHVADSIAVEYVDAGSLAGLSVAVVRGSDTLLMKAYGYADLEWDVPMPIDAIHEIGSVTKQFTSVAMLQLAADGKVDLDADLTEYLPDYDTQGRAIPLRRLFDHTSGIKGYTEIPDFGRLAPQQLPQDSLVVMFESKPLEFEPGHALIYNNSAFFLLGLIIEEVSGQSYDDYLEEHVFPKAGMDDTSYCTDNEVWDRRARGYAPGADGLVRAQVISHIWPYAAGSICSTVGDMVAWNQALHGGRILDDAEYTALVTPRPLEDGTPTRYAMGIANMTAPSGHVIEHGGGIPGFLSHSRYYPEEDVTIVVLQNTAAAPGPEAVADALGESLLGSDALPTAGDFDGDLNQFEGRYRGPARGQTLTAEVTVEDGMLHYAMNGSPGRPLDYLSGTTFFRGEGHFIFEGTGQMATTLRVDQVGGHYVLGRIEDEETSVMVPPETLATYVGSYGLTPQFLIEITVEEGQLFGQATGQPRFPLIADSQTEFHLEVVEASVEFVVGEDGSVNEMILHQGGRSQRGTRMPNEP